MKHLLLCAFLLASLARARAEEPPPHGSALSAQVREIFRAKCVDCHGAQLNRPKGKFGYVLDLARVAGNTEYVERGHAERSELYRLVHDDEMPGDDADVPPLTPQEKQLVKAWINSGAPAAPLAAASVEIPTTAKRPLPTWKQALRWIGHFHPLSTHFPIALMFVALFAEGIAWWTRGESWLHTVRFLVVLSALAAAVSTVLGWIDASFASYVGQSATVLSWHRWLGTVTSVWTLICTGLVLASKCEEGGKDRQRFRGALILGAVLVGITGFLGSSLIYGLDHYSWR